MLKGQTQKKTRTLLSPDRCLACYRDVGWEKLKYHPFWGSPLFYKAPPRQVQPPKCKLDALQNTKLSRGDLCVFLYKNCRLEVANPFLEGVNLHFGGRQFTFWRPKLSWGCFIEKGRSPKRVVFWIPASRIAWQLYYCESTPPLNNPPFELPDKHTAYCPMRAIFDVLPWPSSPALKHRSILMTFLSLLKCFRVFLAPLPLSFLSLVFWNSLVNFKQGIPLVISVFSLAFPRF